MRRWLMNVACVWSLGLFLAVAALWATSYWRGAGVSWDAHHGPGATLVNFPGTANIRLYYPCEDGWGGVKWDTWPAEGILDGAAGEYWGENIGSGGWLGFGFAWWSGRGGFIWELALPYWALVIVALALPMLRVRGFRRERTLRNKSCCRGCGYDLRASEGRCPECGVVIPDDLAREPIA